MTLTVDGRVHADVIVLLLRLIHSHNQSPTDGFQRLLDAIGDEEAARAVFPDIQFGQVVTRVSVRAKGETLAAFDPLRAAGYALLFSGLSADEVVQPTRISVQMPTRPGSATNDAWLALSGLRTLLPIGFDPDFEEGEEELHIHSGELMIDKISVETAWLSAFLELLQAEAPASVEE